MIFDLWQFWWSHVDVEPGEACVLHHLLFSTSSKYLPAHFKVGDRCRFLNCLFSCLVSHRSFSSYMWKSKRARTKHWIRFIAIYVSVSSPLSPGMLRFRTRCSHSNFRCTVFNSVTKILALLMWAYSRNGFTVGSGILNSGPSFPFRKMCEKHKYFVVEVLNRFWSRK